MAYMLFTTTDVTEILTTIMYVCFVIKIGVIEPGLRYMYKFFANVLPWIHASTGACHLVQGSKAKYSLSLCTSKRSPSCTTYHVTYLVENSLQIFAHFRPTIRYLKRVNNKKRLKLSVSIVYNRPKVNIRQTFLKVVVHVIIIDQ